MIRTRAVAVLLSTTWMAMLSGCLAFGPTTAGPETVSGAAFSGMVHGGEQPVVGAQIELFAAGCNGNA